jgi:hypothetical protein
MHGCDLGALLRGALLAGIILAATFRAGAASLGGAFVPFAGASNINLTSIGTMDWAHWGLGGATNVNRKAAVVPRIGALTNPGPNPTQQLNTNLVGFTWHDGTPTAAITNTTTGLFVQGLTNGFQITAAADPERRRLRIYAGAFAASGLLEATLSDASAPGYYDESLSAGANSTNGTFVIDFAAASSGQSLTVRLTAQSLYDAAGFISLQAAALASNVAPAVQLLLPTNNAKFFRSASIPLEAAASDNDGSIQKVEFYQGAAKLGESLAAPYSFLWENVNPGAYTLTAVAFDNEGATNNSIPVAVTVLSNFAPVITLLSPQDLDSFSAPANISLVANASDVDGLVTRVEFFQGTNKLGEATNNPYSITWTNPPAGEYFLTARATDNSGAATTSSAVDIFVTQSGSFLSASSAIVVDPVNLDAQGPADWAHWGLYTENSFDHKRGVAPQISDYSLIGGEPAYPYSDNANTYSWSDGTPTASATNTPTGVYAVGRGNGFHVQAPAGLTTNTLKVYVGAFAARGRLLAYLSDFSAPVLSDVSVDNSGNGPSTVYSLQYASTFPGTLLHVRFIGDTLHDTDFGNVTLQAVALDTGNHPPSVAVTNPSDGSTYLSPANLTISADASDLDGSVTNVEFFRDGVKFGQQNLGPYTTTWTNVPPGSHVITARATDNLGATFTSRGVEIFVTTGGGALVASSAFPPAQLDLSAEGALDWTHWGLSKSVSFDHRIGATTRVANATRIGGGQIKRYADNFTGFSWTNGTPTPSASASPTGVFIEGLANGFQVLVPADTERRRLKMYVGLYGARARFEASLSDSSARSFVDTSLFNIYGNHYRVYTIDYKAATPGQQLVIRHTADQVFDLQSGNVTLQSATLVDLPASHLLGPAWNGNAFTFRFPTLSNWFYTVEYSDILPATNWKPLEAFPGTGLEVWITNSPPSSPQRFYRVVEH